MQRAFLTSSGSPPREWGQLEHAVDGPALGRFTPTRVGTAAATVGALGLGMVHPHASGDSTCQRSSKKLPIGSPPREWGQRLPEIGEDSQRGFTPTRVGTATSAGAGASSCAVHPHASGDSSLSHNNRLPAIGSPPREWGQLPQPQQPAASHRFTPTRVGTASTSWGKARAMRVHPHASGDSFSAPGFNNVGLGSPPREWGQLWYTLSSVLE